MYNYTKPLNFSLNISIPSIFPAYSQHIPRFLDHRPDLPDLPDLPSLPGRVLGIRKVGWHHTAIVLHPASSIAAPQPRNATDQLWTLKSSMTIRCFEKDVLL